jgi:hypothetical protein
MRLKRAAVVLVIVIVALLIWAAVNRQSRPVLVHIPFKTNSMAGSYNYAVFNPFRDRSVERVAAKYVGAMKLGNGAEAMKYSRDVVLPNDMTCEQMQVEYRDYRGGSSSDCVIALSEMTK